MSHIVIYMRASWSQSGPLHIHDLSPDW